VDVKVQAIQVPRGVTAATHRRIDAAGSVLILYVLVLVHLLIGAMKFTADEAQGVTVLVERSPLMSWAYAVWSVQGFSNLLGVVEIGLGSLIALRQLAPRPAAAGSLGATAMFLTTLSFMITTPGWDPKLGGFPALSGAGQFLIKDVVLLGAAVWTLGEALGWIAERRSPASGLYPIATRGA
jgi:uncharacterized membrane protein YkgB